MAKTPTNQDYVMDVLLRNYCRTSEENELLYEEVYDLRNALKILFEESADLRFRMSEAGIEVPPSEFVILDNDDEEVVVGITLEDDKSDNNTPA